MRFGSLLFIVVLAGCDVGWGGASIALVNPAPAPEAQTPQTAAPEAVAAPLPEGDLLYVARIDPLDGTAALAVAAALVDGIPAGLDIPPDIDSAYRARFDSVFYAGGLELSLHAAGRRIGSVVMDGPPSTPAARCLSVGTGTAVLPPGTSVPEYAFARVVGSQSGAVRPHPQPAEDDRMRTFGPVLAENLLRQGGERRPYLAQRADLQAIPWDGDGRPAMAATYLVNDDLTGSQPSNAASSLFVLARFDPTRGYQPEWWEVRMYGGGEPREAFSYLGAFTTGAGRVDVARRYFGERVGLVASVDREDRRIDWMEDGACSVLGLLGSVGAE